MVPRIIVAVLALAFALTAAAALEKSPPPKKKEPTLGEKVVAYCAEHKGKQVGSGQCADLAIEALKAVGAKSRGKDNPKDGDYTWGELVYTLEQTAAASLKETGKKADLKPGDVVQFRDTKWITRNGNRISTRFAPHHTAVIRKVEEKGAPSASTNKTLTANSRSSKAPSNPPP